MRLAAYCRTSALEEDRGDVPSVDDQRAIAEAFARSRGHRLVADYHDVGYRARPGRRPLGASTRGGLAELLDGAAARKWEAVVVLDVERLDEPARRELEQLGRRVLVVPAGEVEQLLVAARARPASMPPAAPAAIDSTARRRAVSERLLRGRVAAAANGRFVSGPAPFGYQRVRGSDGRRHLDVDEAEAELVRWIFRQYVRLRSIARVIALLEQRGSRTRRGRRWSTAGVAWILQNDTYVGHVHFGALRRKGTHPAIVPPILFNRAKKLLRENAKMAPRAHAKRAAAQKARQAAARRAKRVARPTASAAS